MAKPDRKVIITCAVADQVSKMRTILDGLSLDVATPDEARAMLQLKGVDHVAF